MLSFDNNVSDSPVKSIKSVKSTISDKAISHIVNNSQSNTITFIDNVFYIKNKVISLITLENFVNGDKQDVVLTYLFDEHFVIIDSEFTLNLEMMINLYNLIEHSESLSDILYEVICRILFLLNRILNSNKLNNDDDISTYKNYYNKFVIILQKYVTNKLSSFNSIISTVSKKLDDIFVLRKDILSKLNNI